MTAATSSPRDATLAPAEELTSSPRAPESERRALDQPPAATIVQAMLRALGFVVIPALLVGLTLRYLVPSPASATGWQQVVARIGNGYPVLAAFGLFVLFGWIVRHWLVALPRGGYFARLPARLLARLPHRDRPRFLAAAAVYRIFTHARSAEALRKNPELASLVAELGDTLFHARVERVTEAEQAVRALGASTVAAHRRREEVLFVAGLGVAAAMALLLRLRVVETYQVLSGSMLPALMPGDRIIANKLAYRTELLAPSKDVLTHIPQRGDVIVFDNTVTDGPPHLLKRVIGLPGDTVTMHGDTPIINGWPVPSCDAGLYAYPTAEGALRGRVRVEYLGDHAYVTLQNAGLRTSDPYVVKPNEIFVLGDNRSASSDSRSWNAGSGGGVPFDAVQARADAFLLATRRDGTVDFSGIFESIDRRLPAYGVDTRALEEGIQKCVTNWPADTRPPQPDLPTSEPASRP